MSHHNSGIKVSKHFEHYNQISKHLNVIGEEQALADIQDLIEHMTLLFFSLDEGIDKKKEIQNFIEIHSDLIDTNTETCKTLKDFFLNFMKRNMFNIDAFYFFKEDESFFLVKIEHDEILKKCEPFFFVTPYSYSTSTGYSSYEDFPIPFTREELDAYYNTVVDDWDRFTGSYFITETALSQTIVDYESTFLSFENMLISRSSVYDKVKELKPSYIQKIYKDLLVEKEIKNKNIEQLNGRDYLRLRKEIINCEDFDDKIINLHKDILSRIKKELTTEELFNSYI